MMRKGINYLSVSVLVFAFLGLSLLACDPEAKEEVEKIDSEYLSALIVETEVLLAGAEEGLQPDLYIPGSMAVLEEVLLNAKLVVQSATTDKEIASATYELKEAVTVFESKKLREAMPYIKQKSGSCVKFSSNIMSTINDKFTLELDYYILDLVPIGYCNNLITCEQMQPVAGFTVRYFADGSIEIVVGGNEWFTVKSEPNVLKTGTWMHIAFSCDGTSHKLYIDGVETLSLDAPQLASNVALRIGCGQDYPDRVVNAMVKDVRLWNVLRSESQINSTRDAVLTGNETGLEAFFPLTIDLGRVFKDTKDIYTAFFLGDVELVYDGGVPEIVLNYAALDAAIESLNVLKSSVVEGSADGQYPAGTLDLIASLLEQGNEAKSKAQWQKEVDKESKHLAGAVEIIGASSVRPTAPPEGKYSAIFGAGSFLFQDESVIYDMKHSGFSTVIIWTIHITEDASMVFNETPVIDKDGNYIGGDEWGNNIAKLLQAPTTINRIELGIGAWGATAWASIKKLIDQEGTGPDTKLYKNIKTLVDMTGATAINYDDELTYDVASTVAFSLMLSDMGLKVGLCPYTRTSYWKSVYDQVEAKKPGTIDRVYLQCYAGGAGNSPSSWNQYFGDVKVSMGLWSKHGSGCGEGDSPAQIANKISSNKSYLDGGFIWLYDDVNACSTGQTKDYSSAINKNL